MIKIVKSYLLILISALLIVGLISCSSRLNPSDDSGTSDNGNPTVVSEGKEPSSSSVNSTGNTQTGSSGSEKPSSGKDESTNPAGVSTTFPGNPTVVSEGKEPSSSSGNSTDNTQTGSSGSEKPSTPPKVPTTFLERVKGATYEGSGFTYKFSKDGKTIDCGENGKHATYIYVQQDDDNRAVYKEENAPWYKFGLIYYGLKLDKDDILYWTSGFADAKTTPSSWGAFLHPAYRK